MASGPAPVATERYPPHLSRYLGGCKICLYLWYDDSRKCKARKAIYGYNLVSILSKIVLFSQDGSAVLLARRRGEADYDGVFSFIGGKLESTDGGLVNGLRREKNEEIGSAAKIAVVTSISVNEYFVKTNGQAMVLPHYYARFIGGEIMLNDEYSEYRWVNLRELDQFEPKIETIAPTVEAVQKIMRVATEADYREM